MGVESDPRAPTAQEIAVRLITVLTKRLLPVAVVVAWLFAAPLSWALNTERLEPADIALHQSVMQALEPLITAKKQDGTANVLTWDALYQPLSPEQRAFLDAFRALDAKTLGATAHDFADVPNPDLVPVGPQRTVKDGTAKPLDLQYLPRHVSEAYRAMMAAMQKDLGRSLLVESGYRSPAYQLYLFLFYMPKHDYSPKETNRHVALPGHSEHGYPPRQAIDFINEAGINGEDHPEEFEALPEYAWLQQHAKEFGFALSYPRENAYHTSFEPWHWHFEGK